MVLSCLVLRLLIWWSFVHDAEKRFQRRHLTDRPWCFFRPSDRRRMTRPFVVKSKEGGSILDLRVFPTSKSKRRLNCQGSSGSNMTGLVEASSLDPLDHLQPRGPLTCFGSASASNTKQSLRAFFEARVQNVCICQRLAHGSSRLPHCARSAAVARP
jgi:hypothetical protein